MSGAPRGSRVGTRFGPYQLRRLIGAGGFGEVYEAEDTVKDRVVALKLLPEALSKDPVFRKRMQREAHAAGRLQEPHVVPIHDYGEIDGLLFVDMRLIDGTDLHSLLEDEGPLPPVRAVAFVRQVASALDAAHVAGVMHRDVKPENILITRDDFACLVDFGLATAATDERLTQMGTMVGTFSYMAPERLRNKEVTHRADIYSLACVLHECLTGSRPYRATSLGAIINAHLNAPIPQPSKIRPGIPPAFDHIVERGMAKKPEDRYASAGELALAAVEALTVSDQQRAASILERSIEATEPGVRLEPRTQPFQPPPTPPTAGSGPMQRYAGTAPSSGPQRAAPPPRGSLSSGPQRAAPPPRGTLSSGPRYAAPPAPRTPPHQPAAKGSRTPWIVGGALAAIVAVVVAVVLFVTKPWSPGSEPTPTTRTTPPTTTTSPKPSPAQNKAKLMTLLPQGFSSSNCQDHDDPPQDSLASVQCTDNSLPNGLTAAWFSLFPDQATMDKRFDRDTKLTDMVAELCPGGLDSPGTWHKTNTPDKVEGQLVCGAYQGTPDLEWTNNADLLLSDIRGADLDALYQWWAKNA